MAERNYWFGHRWLGIGYSPASWQGWLSLMVFIVIFAASLREAPVLVPGAPVAATLAVGGLELALYLWLIWAKRDKSRDVRWRWFGR
jgi:hypothetical protein